MKDSTPGKWEYREHTKVKHILLEKYLTAWIPILGKHNPTICYFDSFAGRGEYTDGTLGSPLIALKVADEQAKHFSKLTCFFIEKDPDNFKNLEDVLSREQPNIRNWHKLDVKTRNGEFANVVNGIFQSVREGYILVPSFFFVDPFGFSGIPFETVIKILSNPKTEVFFTFMSRDMARFIELPELKGTFSNLFGTDKWKSIAASSQGQPREIALISLYREQLHNLAGVKYSLAFRVCMSGKEQTLYYLVHATNNFKGHSVMKTIMFNQSAQGNFAYLGPQDTAARIQLKLFDINSIEELRTYLLERFRGKTITYDNIQQEICMPWYSEPPYIDKQYRDALTQLERDGMVTVNRITSKTQRGLSKDDRIAFRP